MKNKQSKTKIAETKIDSKKIFGLECPFEILSFEDFSPPAELNELVPALDENYLFDPTTTLALLAGFTYNQRVLVAGMHGSGKSTHIEQVAARLNWPVLRINFDSQITRLDLVGKDIITLKEGKQISEFKEGVIPYAIKRPIALVLDEYDAIRPEVSFIIQRILEQDGKFALLEENQIITPHSHFRLFATSNTLGMGDDLGLYHGTNLINQGQMDRWNIVANLGYLSPKREQEILLKKAPFLAKTPEIVKAMVQMAELTRKGFENGDLSSLMSLRTLLSWATNYHITTSLPQSFIFSFLNKNLEEEKPILNEYYQRVFGQDLPNFKIK